MSSHFRCLFLTIAYATFALTLQTYLFQPYNEKHWTAIAWDLIPSASWFVDIYIYLDSVYLSPEYFKRIVELVT